MPRRLHRQGLPAAWSHRDIQIHRVGGDSIHGTGLPPKFAANHAHVGAVVVRDLRDVGGLHLLVTRRRHFERGRKVGPQLEAMHAAGVVAFGHLLMDDAAARRHPLNVAGRDGALVPHAVAMLDGSGQDVRDGLDAAVGVPRETRQVILRNVVAEVVEQQKRVEIGSVAEAERAAQVHARAFEGRLGFDEPLNWSNGHSSPFGVCRENVIL
jgi:hypothetical protein